MKANNDAIKCHLKKISSCEHYGYLMDCPMVTRHFLTVCACGSFPPPSLYYMVKCYKTAVDIIRTKYCRLLRVDFLHHHDFGGLQSC